LTTIIGTIGALVLGGAIGTFTLMSVVTDQTSPKGDSPANVSVETEIAYGSASSE